MSTKPRYVIAPLSMAPFPPSFLDAINGYATGGSTRCLEAIHEEGAWLDTAAPDPLPQGDLREAVARVLAKQRGHIDIGHSIWMNEAKSEAPVWHFYLEDADAILALLTPAECASNPGELTPARSGWRPIESAPKDGTQVLTWGCLHDDGGVDMGEIPSAQISQMTEFGWSCPLLGGHYPTHWMPLPEAPSVGGEP